MSRATEWYRRNGWRVDAHLYGAVDALLALDGSDDVSRAYSAVQGPRRRADLLELAGWKESRGRACVHRLLGKRCPEDRYYHEPIHLSSISQHLDPALAADDLRRCLPPGADHTSLLLKDGKPIAIFTQPYDVGFETMESLVAWCKHYGVRADIEGWSWHFPGRTLGVMIRRQDDHRVWPSRADSTREEQQWMRANRKEAL